MEKTVLVLTNSEDGPHTSSVISKIRQWGRSVFRFDTDKIAAGELEINLSVGEDFSLEFREQSSSIKASEIDSVWYRRPNHFKLPINDTVQREYAEKEITYLLEGLWSNLHDVFWLSNPHNLQRARKKTLQLQLAKDIGFCVPRTLITNNPDRVKDFFQACSGKIVFKAIYHEFLVYGTTQYNIPTTLITDAHLEKIDLVRTTPALFQEFIDKEHELRVTVVGDKFFPVRIDSQDNPLTIVDWRHPRAIPNLSYQIVTISEETCSMCLDLMQELGIEFGAFDFAIGKNGQLYFLEVNPNGQWYWLEDLTGVAISDAIADLLCQALLRKGE